MHVGIALLLAPLSVLGEIPDARLVAIRDGFGTRRDAMLERQVRATYPPVREGSDQQLVAWNRLDFALSALHLNVQTAEANRAVLDVVAMGTDLHNSTGEERFHWIAPLLIRIHELFCAKSQYFPGRLSCEAEQGIRDLLWEYARKHCRHAFFKPQRVWWCWGSENHDAQRVQAFWGAAKILAAAEGYRDRTFDDGATACQHLQALDAFVQTRFRERIRHGLLAETASPGYSKYTLAGWYNYYDFGGPELRRLAGAALTLWWADWAQEQFATVRGGAKARVYQGSAAQSASADSAASMAWYYLGIGPPRNPHPGIMCMATSSYRLPLVVMDLALDPGGRGRYEYLSRRPGLAMHAGQPRQVRDDGMNLLDPNCPGLVRYTYCTPGFIAGSWWLEKRPWRDWVGFSSQNRWQGVIFAGHDPNARIFPQCEGLRNGKTYNQYWSVQHQGAMIVARLPSSEFSKQAGDLRVYFAPGLERNEQRGWIFTAADHAYAAVRFLDANASSEPAYRWDDSRWARAADSSLPVVIEASEKKCHASFTAFIEAVLDNRCELDSQKLVYRGLHTAKTMTFYLASDRLPELDGQPIDLSPSKTFDSPFLQQHGTSGIVTITKGSRRWKINVSAASDG